MRPLHLLAVVALVGAPIAAQDCAHVVLAPETPNWGASVVLPRFDPLRGTLTRVRVELGASIDGASRIEHLGATGASYTLSFQALFELRRPDASLVLAAQPAWVRDVALSAHDGTLDFGGSSGATLASSAVTVPTATVVLTDAADLALFTGPIGAPGTVALDARASNTSTAIGPGDPVTQFAMQAAADLRVCFEFTPRISSFCFGDGSGAACPCGNEAPAGSAGGCLASLGLAGILVGVGEPRLSADTFVLQASSLPPSASALYFQGTHAIDGGAGAAFGDGLRCVGGSIVRLGARISVGGASHYPSGGRASIAQVGGVASPGVRTYQVWYRNGAAYCTPAAFNLTNGVSVSWLP